MAALGAHASDAIPAPTVGVSASVTQPHVTARLISETTYLTPGKPFLVALHLHMDAGWHTYWINPGDAGLATAIKWTLPPGFTAGPIQWPTPEVHAMGPLTTYGYAGDVYLLTTITPPADVTRAPGQFEIKAHATWLVCQEECIPGKGDFLIKAGFGVPTVWSPAWSDEINKFFSAAKARLPVSQRRWLLTGAYDQQSLILKFVDTYSSDVKTAKDLYFFPEQGNVIDPKEDPSKIDLQHPSGGFNWSLALQQNGEKPGHLSGVLVSSHPLAFGGIKTVYLPSFSVTGGNAANPMPAPAASVTAPTPATAPPFLLAVLGAAFLGGLILNLMPCVLPVLSLKVFSLIRHAGENPRGAWRQGAAFTAGVVISFWVLAGLLLVLRAAGGHLGWGFQMQSPGFVFALILIFFLLALNLFGLFELGTSLVGLDAKAAGHGSGLASSFLNGALATLAATPCTAPFMGSALGFAAEQPPYIALLVFTTLALGMAAPYLLLTIFPGALRFVPKPGAWMEAVKQFMGFLLLATVIFLVYVFTSLVGADQTPSILTDLLTVGIGAWIYGRWATPGHTNRVRGVAIGLAVLLLAHGILWGAKLSTEMPSTTGTTASADGWQPWTPAAVEAAQAQGRPVFVDFTAAWCLSCKVNERVALDTDAVRAAFAQKNVVLFRADWTRSDPAISATLQQYHRDGVPLYLLYPAQAGAAPQVLPEVLTPDIVLDALKKI